MRARREQDQLLPAQRHLRERRGRLALRHEGCVQLAILHRFQQRIGRTGGQLQPHRRVLLVIARQQGRQAARSRAVQRADPQHATRRAVLQGAARLLGKVEHLLGKAEKQLTRRREVEPPAVAHEQRRPQRGFQLLDAGRDVGLDPMQLAGRGADPAFVDDCLEHLQSRKIHRSLSEMEAFAIFHFSESSCQSRMLLFDRTEALLRTFSPLRLATAGMLTLAAAIGIGRFAFTPVLPMMQKDLGLSLQAAGWLASANYAGYFVGALSAVWLRGRAAYHRPWRAHRHGGVDGWHGPHLEHLRVGVPAHAGRCRQRLGAGVLVGMGAAGPGGERQQPPGWCRVRWCRPRRRAGWYALPGVPRVGAVSRSRVDCFEPAGSGRRRRCLAGLSRRGRTDSGVRRAFSIGARPRCGRGRTRG